MKIHCCQLVGFFLCLCLCLYRHWRFLQIDKTRLSFSLFIFIDVRRGISSNLNALIKRFWTHNGVARWKQKVVLRFACPISFLFSFSLSLSISLKVSYSFLRIFFSIPVLLLAPFTTLFGSLDKAAIRRRQRRRWINHLFVGEWLACLDGKCERCNNIFPRESPHTCTILHRRRV